MVTFEIQMFATVEQIPVPITQDCFALLKQMYVISTKNVALWTTRVQILILVCVVHLSVHSIMACCAILQVLKNVLNKSVQLLMGMI